MTKYNDYRLRCKAVALYTLFISCLLSVLALSIARFTVNVVALNIIFYACLLCVAVAFGSIAVLILYFISCLVTVSYKKKGIMGSAIVTEVDEIDVNQIYDVWYVRTIFRKFVIRVEECR